jgi:flagellar biosynthesis chaperone FliJ
MDTKINNLEITMAELKTDISYIKKSLENNEEQHREIIKNQEAYMREMKEFIEKVIAEKADKWVEDFLRWAGAVIGLVLLMGVLGLIAQAYLHLNK